MVQGYYTIQEAAKFLAVSLDELKMMAQKGQIRSFQDRGTLRFRIQDIQEQARLRGASSDPEQVLGESIGSPAPKSSPRSSASRKSQGPKTPSKQQPHDVPEVFDFEFDNENVDLGADFLAPRSGSKRVGGKSGKKPSTPKPSPGSDSDVRLVADGSDVNFTLAKDSDIKLADSEVKKTPDPSKPRSSAQASSQGKRSSQLVSGSGVQPAGKGGSGAKGQPSPRPGNTPQPIDSGVRLVPMDSDSDVKLLGSSDEVQLGESPTPSHGDSNVRLDRIHLPPADSGEGNMLQTEEINLDEELRKLEESDKKRKNSRVKPKSELKLPTSSPFELSSDTDLQIPLDFSVESGPKTPARTKGSDADSSDFDLQPTGDTNLIEDENDFTLQIPDGPDNVVPRGGLTKSGSGISLGNPVDAGISLEEGGGDDSVDFDLSLEVEDTPRPVGVDPASSDSSDFQLTAATTPRPVEDSPADSQSEFELTLDSEGDVAQFQEGGESDIDLSLDVESEEVAALPKQGDSEFELNLDGSGEGGNVSGESSEFELTLDDSGSVGLDSEESAPQVKSKKGKQHGEDADIFEADFEVPALGEGEEGTVQDSELESSDFDLALDDSELAPEEESGSQVVALDEEDPETLVDSESGAAVVDDVEVEDESSDFGDLDQDVQADVDPDVEIEEEPEAVGARQTVIKDRLVEPAPWGALPVVFLLPCVIVMFLVGILGYELVQTTAGLRPPGPLTLAVADILGQQITVKK